MNTAASHRSDRIQSTEIEYYIKSIRKFQLNEFGSKYWFESHEQLIKLNQQAILEITQFREELIKELLIVNDKLKILIHEIISIYIWRIKILPTLLEFLQQPEAEQHEQKQPTSTSFLLYSICFHEANAIGLLEIALYHENGCTSIGDCALDLIDYCIQSLTQLIGFINSASAAIDPIVYGYQNTNDFNLIKDNIDKLCNESIRIEFQRQTFDLLYKIGMRSITILNYLIDKIELLPLSAGNRLMQIHDTPCILSELLHIRPWLRFHRTNGKCEKFINDEWHEIKKNNLEILKITKHEAQTWFSLRQILLNKKLFQKYSMNGNRQRQLQKCIQLLNDQILDQLPPLFELKQFLCQSQFTFYNDFGRGESKQYNLILEQLPMVKDEILKNSEKFGWKLIIDNHKKKFINLKYQDIVEYAKWLHLIYTISDFEYIENNDSHLNVKQQQQVIKNENNRIDNNIQLEICGNCKKNANKKCSKCLRIYYCTRECQIKDWSKHKPVCGGSK